jgi:Sec-independent protein translocase protein TatA
VTPARPRAPGPGVGAGARASTIAPMEILIVVLIAVIVWRGPKTFPQIGAMLGRTVREAREAARGDDEDGKKAG